MNTRSICGIFSVLLMLVCNTDSVALGGSAEPPAEAQAPPVVAEASVPAGTPARTSTGEASPSAQRVSDHPSEKSSSRLDGNDGGAIAEYAEYLKLHRHATRAFPFR